VGPNWPGSVHHMLNTDIQYIYISQKNMCDYFYFLSSFVHLHSYCTKNLVPHDICSLHLDSIILYTTPF
jgi:hypothetical protein